MIRPARWHLTRRRENEPCTCSQQRFRCVGSSYCVRVQESNGRGRCQQEGIVGPGGQVAWVLGQKRREAPSRQAGREPQHKAASDCRRTELDPTSMTDDDNYPSSGSVPFMYESWFHKRIKELRRLSARCEASVRALDPSSLRLRVITTCPVLS